MLASFLMGLVGGQRAMTPLAAVALAAALRGREHGTDLTGAVARHPLTALGAVVLAVGEMAGDKKKDAPDRIVPIGIAARFVTSAIAGAVLTPGRQRLLGAAIGGVTAVAASYPGWRLRVAAMPRCGQTLTGLVEDGLVVASALAVVRNRYARAT
jgi:uncharacterized membrane protein